MGRKNKKLSIEEVRVFIESEGCELVSTEYVNANKKIEIKFECGHIREMKLGNFYSGNRCNCDMVQRRVVTKRNNTIEKIKKKLEDAKFTFVSFPNKYLNWDSLITYRCNLGHLETRPIVNFLRSLKCKTCSRIENSVSNSGKNSPVWKGGTTSLKKFVSNNLSEWKRESMDFCNYKCIITGNKFDDIHHLYPLNKIVQEALFELGLERYEFIGDYNEEDLTPITNKIVEIHYRYPLGVCLTKKIHKKFHQIYSNNCTPEQFYEFAEKIKSGEIKI